MRFAVFQPDIPQNLGGFIRLSACLGFPLEVIEPCGFPLDDRRLKRAALDYGPRATVRRWDSWAAFEAGRAPGRLVLFTTRGAEPLSRFALREDDTLLFGRESAGVPEVVHAACDARVYIPLAPGARSLNVVAAAAMAGWEAARGRA